MKHKQKLFSLRIIGATGPNPNHSFQLKLEQGRKREREKGK